MKDLTTIHNAGALMVEDTIDRMQKFTKRLNALPNAKFIVVNKAANNSDYLPISHIEATLDKMFMGAWQTRNMVYQVISNEVVCTIELHVLHPVLGQWIQREGAAAVPIQMQAGSNINDVSSKYKNALVKDFPHLKSEAIKNAAKSLGKIFGRDLNRQHQDTYQPFELKPINQ